MCEVPVFYATTEGQTRRIAERVVAALLEHGLDSRALAVDSAEASAIDWAHVRGACVAEAFTVETGWTLGRPRRWRVVSRTRSSTGWSAG